MARSKSTAPTEAQSVRSEALPDRETLKGRLQELRDTTWNAQAIVKSAVWAIREAIDACTDPAHSLTRTLDIADELLQRVGSGLDSSTLLAPAEAQEVARG